MSKEQSPNDDPNKSADENRLIAERRQKLAEMKAEGVAYPNGLMPTHQCDELASQYADHTKEALEKGAFEVSVGGRLMARRVMGKASFATLRDGTSDLQLFLQRDVLAEGQYAKFKRWDLGDIVFVRGVMYRTNKGELSVSVAEITLLSKCLRPLPEKFHGLTDQEMRYRQRYVDLIVNESSRQVFRQRAQAVKFIRDFLEERAFLEVETPMMHYISGGAAAKPFTTHHNALDLDLYLRVAPELYLKRLTVGGFEKVYEINRNFRNEGVSTRHNPEFTMLEFYWAYATFHDLMDLTEALLRGLAERVTGSAQLTYQGMNLDFAQPFQRITVAQAVLDHNRGLSEGDLRHVAALRAHAQELGIAVNDGWGWGKLQMEIYEDTVEAKLTQPTFVTEYPTEVSPLSRCNDNDPELTDRFELIIAGREIANGFSELNDPEDQAERFRQQVANQAAGDDEAMQYDADYVRALEYGLPPTAGEGIGIDRLVMLLTDSPSIRDVLLFPYMRPDDCQSAPPVEALSLDEAFLDVSASHRLHGDGVTIAGKIREDIRSELNLTGSVGVASNKYLAKIASDINKPDGMTVVPDPPQPFLDPLPVRKIWGVGVKSAERLATLGIKTIGDLRRLPDGRLNALLGRSAVRLAELARGIDDRPVVPDRGDKSISHEETYGTDLTELLDCDRQVMELACAVGARLRNKDLCGQVVRIKIRLGDFTTLSRQRSLQAPINDDQSLSAAARDLLRRWWRIHPDCAIRLLGVGVSHLQQVRQTDLFGPSQASQIDAIKDRISDRFKNAGLRPAALVKKPVKPADQ
nr:lysine--tRNA ligase-like [Nerophis lumbriciformis]